LRGGGEGPFVPATTSSATAPSPGTNGARCPGCQQRDDTIRKLQQQIAELRRQLQAERERSRRDTTNSSTPPSQNALDGRKPQRPKKPSGRKRGGQPGHADTSPGSFPPEQLTEPPIPCLPDTCPHCQSPLSGVAAEDAVFTIHQVVELPPLTPEIREYHRYTCTCKQCGQTTLGPLPDGVPTSDYGPRLQAFVALCTACYHLSKRQVEELLNLTFNIPISLGTICNLEQRVSAAVAEPVAEAQRQLLDAEVVNADETSWPEQPKKSWLWAGVSAAVAVFLVRRRRDLASAQALLGANFAGVLGCDRYGAYRWVQRRQLCWAHLDRDWQALIDRGGTSRRIGRQLAHLTDQLFHLWHRVRDGTLCRSIFAIDVTPIRRAVADCLRQGARCAHPRTAGTCADILAQEEALWTFVDVPGVEPTNNAAERVVRQAVLWRRKSFGTRSPKGSCFVERLLTVVATCRLQGRNVLDYLTAACTAALTNQPAPSLLPR
jgi:transposase